MFLSACLCLQGRMGAKENPPPPQNPFFVMDNGLGRGKLTPAQQAGVVKDLGFDGISYNGTREHKERLAAFDEAGLKIFGLYVHKDFDKSPVIDQGLANAIRTLKGRDTVIWLTVGKLNKGEDADDVRVVREVADLAAASGVRVAIHPHRGNHVETAEDAVRIVKQVDAPMSEPASTFVMNSWPATRSAWRRSFANQLPTCLW